MTIYDAAEPENVATVLLHEQLGFEPVSTVTLPGSDQRLALSRREAQGDEAQFARATRAVRPRSRLLVV